jgi:hypothetical protein
MNRLSRRTSIIAASTAAAVLIAGGAAVAYWTTTGSGTGTATAGTTAPVTIAQVGSVTGLYPGGPAQTISFKVTNPNPGSVTLSAVAVAVSGTSDAGCTAADFTVVDPTDVAGPLVGGGNFTSTTATIKMDNTASNQDACKSAAIDLTFAAS